MADGRLLSVGASGDAGAVFAALGRDYTVHAEPVRTMTWTWLDTADWRLHRAGIALREERVGRRRDLVVDRDGGTDPGRATASLASVRWPARLEAALTGADAAPVRDALSSLVGVRALLPVAEVETRRITLRLMDEAGKTRVRVSVDQQRLLAPRRAALPLHVDVRALRGYDSDAQRCVDLLAETMGASPTTLSPTAAALDAAGHLPGLPGVDDIAISPTDTAVRPVARALLAQVAAVDRARDGAIADHDTEFLRDLRSALRNTRALLDVAGHLLPGRSAQRVLRDLDWLDERTTPLRAVDIAVLELDGDGALDVADLARTVPAASAAPLRELLLRRRARELRRMRQALRSPGDAATFTAWQSDLRAMLDADLIGPSAAESARTLTAASYRGVVAAATGPELRDRVIAMRQILSAFEAVYSAPDVRAGVRADLDSLHAAIRNRDGLLTVIDQLAHLAADPSTPVEGVLAAGALLDRAGHQADGCERRIAKRAARFAGDRSAQRVDTLARTVRIAATEPQR